jgi:phasin family protein
MNKYDRRFNASTAAAEETTRVTGNGYLAAGEAVRDLNMRLIEMTQSNMMAAFDFSQRLATAKGPGEAAAVWSSCAHESFETLTDQSRELTALVQRVMTSTAEPLTQSFGQTLHRKP